MSLDELDLAAQIPGPISARTLLLDGRRVSWFEFDVEGPVVPLTQEMTVVMQRAAQVALEERIPLVLVIVWLWLNPIVFPAITEPRSWATEGGSGSRSMARNR